jgi:hypothetical protein
MRIETAELRASPTGTLPVMTTDAAKPTQVGGINEGFNVVSSVLDMVAVEDLTGMGTYKEAFVKAWGSAGYATEGTASDPSQPTFGSVTLTPHLIDVVGYVSRGDSQAGRRFCTKRRCARAR